MNEISFEKYAVSEDEYAPVYYGNTLKPTHAKNPPEVKFDATKKLVDGQVCMSLGAMSLDSKLWNALFSSLFFSLNFQPDGDTLWTLVLTNPDGHFTENDKEYVHWFV